MNKKPRRFAKSRRPKEFDRKKKNSQPFNAKLMSKLKKRD